MFQNVCMRLYVYSVISGFERRVFGLSNLYA
jgi:hypothetical protein